MAKKKAMKKKARKAAKRGSKRTARKVARQPAKKAAKKSARTSSAKRATRPKQPAAPKTRNGVITHTELASSDPSATRDWCASVLGWKFGDSMPTPAGPYHMWRFDSLGTGGGIRANNPPEGPGSIPYVEVTDIRGTYEKALAAGANEMMAPEEIPGGMGWIAIVAAPGGVPIGFWAMKG